MAFWIIAGGFTLIGLAATRVVTDKENKADIAEKQAGAHDTGATTQAAAQVAVQVLMPLAAALLSAPRPPGTLAAGAKTGRPQYAAGHSPRDARFAVLAERVREQC